MQATIHFYNDESESDSEEEEEEAEPSHLQSREAEGQGSGPGGKGRAGLASLSEEGWFRGKGQLCAEGSERSSE